MITAKKIATDETNVAAKWIAEQPDESSRIYSARLSIKPGIGYEIILGYEYPHRSFGVGAQNAELLDSAGFRWVRDGLPDRRKRSL